MSGLGAVSTAVTKQLPLHASSSIQGAAGGTFGKGDIHRCPPTSGSPQGCANYFASTDVKTSMLGHVARHREKDPAVEVATDPTPTLPLPRNHPPAPPRINATLVAPALTGCRCRVATSRQ